MLLLYIGVCRAVYDYTSQAPEELTISEGDLLYVLEKLDVDEWWKVKKRVVALGNEEVDEPEGLVPLNYIEPAGTVKQCVALFDYDKQTDEELTFKEGERFNIYDDADPDWLLAGDLLGNLFGFLPSNYVKVADRLFSLLESPLPPLPGTQQEPAPAAPYTPTPVPVNLFAPPPIHRDRVEQVSTPQKQVPPPSAVADVEGEEEEAPPMPSRPRSDSSPKSPTSPTKSISSNPEHTYDGEAFTWYIDEIDGRKKRPVILVVGPLFVRLKPNQKKFSKLRGGALSLDNEWRMKDLLEYSSEKKHVFFEFKNPKSSIELHAGSKDVADAITSVLGDFKGADLARGLREVAQALTAQTGAKNRKIGKLLYDFASQSPDELGIKENEEVYILNNLKLKEWWMCQSVTSGRQGVVPLSYIEVVGTSNLDSLTNGARKRHSDPGKKKKRDRNERDRIRERDRRDREKSKKSASDDKMPNYHRVRTWIDLLGLFKVEAEFLGFVEGKIHLHKTNGVKIAVQASKLSVEDLEYVEKVTGNSLELHKDDVIRANEKRERANRRKLATPSLATAAINDIAPPQPARPRPTTAVSGGESEYDWFEFFLLCGIDIGNCQRYTLNFSRERMDDGILEDITPALLRTLGLREGDIIRVMKHLDAKYNRKRGSEEPPLQLTGGLFTEVGGALKNNVLSQEIPKVDATALPSPNKQPPQNDDTWVVKPAARSNEDLLQKLALQPQTPQFTGSLQDLVNIKPYDPNQKVAPAAAPAASSAAAAPLGPTLVPQKAAVPPPRPTAALPNFEPVSAQKTGSLIPVATGGAGLVQAQPTGFLPIQPTGFLPIQATGNVMLMPVVTGQKTGGVGAVPVTSFATGAFQPVIVPLQTGTVTMPATSFGQVTGGVVGGMSAAQLGNGLSLQKTGPIVPQQKTGGMVPVMAPTVTGGNMFSQQTGGQQMQPATSFGQPTGVLPNTTFGQPTGGFPNTSFGQPTGNASLFAQATGGAFVPQLSFGKQVTGGLPPQTLFGVNQVTNLMGQTSLNLQSTNMFGLNPQPTFGQPVPFNGAAQQPQPQPQFGAQPQFASQPQFGAQPQFGSQPQFGAQQPQVGAQQLQFGAQHQFAQSQFGQQFGNQQQVGAQPTTLFGTMPQPLFGQAIQPPFGQAPQPLFGQATGFEGFGQLQSQPTGVGFGNSPMQLQQTGNRSRANLSAATPDNPFGF